MEYLKLIRLKDLMVILVLLYVILWFLDSNQARKIFLETVNTGKEVGAWTLKVASHILRNLYVRLQTGPTSSSSSLNSPPPFSNFPLPSAKTTDLQIFLSSSNEELSELRGGFYNKHPGYYIEVNSDKGTCQARYSKEIEGRWETPAKVLCPQVKILLGREKHMIHQ